MRRLIAALITAACLLPATPAEAGWGWRHCGYGGFGWGGWGGGGGWYGRGFSIGYYPAYGYGYCPPCDCYGPYSYGNAWYPYGIGAPVGLGYYTYRPYGFYGAGTLNQDLLAEALRGVAAKRADRRLDDNARVAPRITNHEWRRKAERYLADGDSLFREQNFHSALQRYKLAASTAPDMAEAYWRQGHALIATSNFDLATRAFKRAIALNVNVGRGGFQLDQLYGGAALTKTAHLESVAELALTRSESPEPYFLLGVFLTYDGQPERAEKFFLRAADLAGVGGGHIAVFLMPRDAAPRVERPAIGAADEAVPVSVGTEI